MKKIIYTIKAVLDDGSTVEREVNLDVEVPDPKQIDRHTKAGLLRDLDKLDKAIINARKQAEQEFAQGYVDEGGKKNA